MLLTPESCEIKNNEFKHIENEICFNCKFLSGLVFSDNSITDLAFSSCGFYYDTIFERLKLLGKFSIFNPQIGGQLKFVGSENDLLFNSKTTIEINSECFEENGMIIFDYCNVLNLGTTFIENCRNLEAKQKVIIHPSCKVERLTMIYEYPLDTELKSNLIEDFANIVSKYFYLWYGINLSVNIIRNRAKKIITVVYKTTDNITDEDFNSLLKKLPEAICYTQKNEPAIIDLQRALFYIIERINSISDNAFKNIFSNILINTRGKYIKNKTDIGTLNEKNNEKTLTENVKEYVEECVKNAFEKYVKDGEKTVIQVQGDYIYSQNGVVVGGENNTLKKSVVKRQSNEHYVDKSAINISLEKKKSFWNGVIGALIIGVIGCAIWYFIQTLIIKR